MVAASGVALQVKDALAQAPGVAAADTDSDGGELISSRCCSTSTRSRREAMDLIPRLREVAREAAGGEPR